jgi:hypothetical protein
MNKDYKILKDLIEEEKYREAYIFSGENPGLKESLPKGHLVRLTNFYENTIAHMTPILANLKKDMESIREELNGVLENKV